MHAAVEKATKEHDIEIGEFQQKVYDLCCEYAKGIDGAGSDSGDWRDFTLAEIGQCISQIVDERDTLQTKLDEANK